MAVSNTSGVAGIAVWINNYFKLKEDEKVTKDDELVLMVKSWVDHEYEQGRVTVITDAELISVIQDACKTLGREMLQ